MNQMTRFYVTTIIILFFLELNTGDKVLTEENVDDLIVLIILIYIKYITTCEFMIAPGPFSKLKSY